MHMDSAAPDEHKSEHGLSKTEQVGHASKGDLPGDVIPPSTRDSAWLTDGDVQFPSLIEQATTHLKGLSMDSGSSTHPAAQHPQQNDPWASAALVEQQQYGQQFIPQQHQAVHQYNQLSYPQPPHHGNPRHAYNQYYLAGQHSFVPGMYDPTMYGQLRQPYMLFDQGGRPMAPHLALNVSYNYPHPGSHSGSGFQNYPRFPSQAIESEESSQLQTTPRGPPRKPRQSGFALWVGNLPPGTTILDLKDHFSREATRDIYSIKLISKSNCAFVNYRTEAACLTAMNRFQDLRFQGTRLVCRLRRGLSADDEAKSPVTVDGYIDGHVNTSEGNSPMGDKKTPVKAAERFFVLKSLTLQDLEASVRNGIWATQAHNEKALNEAYHNAEAVYLIFSANKSGEYFGYARMISPISPSVAAELMSPVESTPQRDNAAPAGMAPVPRSIPTLPTEWAPRGYIIDDSARGTIFWEAENEGPSFQPGLESPPKDGTESPAIASSSSPTKSPISASSERSSEDPLERQSASGTVFRVEWLSTRKVPFYRTKGLRNAWNADREVKIARDGTELETEVGKKLIRLFGGP